MIHLFGHLLFTLLLGYYLILNLQWYNYRLKRILFHHHNPWLHILFFLAPLFAYFAFKEWVWALDVVYGMALFVWLKRVGRALAFTGRVKRFFAALAIFTLFFDLVCLFKFGCKAFSTTIPLAAALLTSNLIEKLLFTAFKNEAAKKLGAVDPTIVAVTASYGKTSMKNFIYQLLAPSFKTYKTPRSVNTLAGILKDINEELPKDCQIYIVEAGARERGDILEIASFLNHHYAVVGKIGPQHIEYFKTLENIIFTKLELLKSKRLKKAFLWDGIEIKDRLEYVKFGKNIKNVQESLEGIEFDLEIDGQKFHFKAPILGGFNALNITAAILVARELGIAIDEIKKRVERLNPIEHRLQRIEAGGKIIIDDSFNGNIEGMIASYELVKQHTGRKVVVTPGVVESDDEANVKLAKKISEVFDLAIITGKINRDILNRHITTQKIILEDKKRLQEVLAQETRAGDLILFSNDAPGYL